MKSTGHTHTKQTKLRTGYYVCKATSFHALFTMHACAAGIDLGLCLSKSRCKDLHSSKN